MERGGSNLSDKGLNSVDRGSKATLPLTIPRRRFKSPAKDSTRRRGNNNSRRSERRSRTDLANDTRLWEPAPTEDVPPQPNSPPDNVLRSIDPPASLDLKEGVVTPPPVHGVSKITRIPLSALSSELAVRRPRNSRELFPVRPRRHATRRLAASSSSSPPTVDGFELGSSSPALRANPFPGYGSILPTSLPTLFHRPEAVHLGDLMRYEYDRRERTRSSGFSRAAECTDTTRRGGALPAAGPYLRLSRFQGGQADRLTHVQVPLTWNLSSSPSKFSFEYLLLPPRSAPTAAPPARALGFAATAAPPTHRGLALAPTAGIGRALQRHPFSGLVDSAGKLRGNQLLDGSISLSPYTQVRRTICTPVSLRPPPEFLWLRPARHSSPSFGPDRHAHTRTLLRRSRSVGSAPVRDPTNQLPYALRVYSPADSHTCQTPWSVFQDGSNGEPTGRRPEHADAEARREARAADHD
ncbi:hypothetical protein Bca4012_103565 [Brassica carinata]